MPSIHWGFNEFEAHLLHLPHKRLNYLPEERIVGQGPAVTTTNLSQLWSHKTTAAHS